jgi:hypothetical protein
MRMLSLAAFIFMFACAQENEKLPFYELAKGPIRHHLIACLQDQNNIKVRGLAGATPAQTKIILTVLDKSEATLSKPDGSFTITIPNTIASHGEFSFITKDKTFKQNYRIRALAASSGQKSALDNMVRAKRDIGKEITSLDFTDHEVAILSSQASLLSRYPLDEHWGLANKPTAILLDYHPITSLGAHMVKYVKDYLLVSLFKTHEVLLVDPRREQTIDRSRLKNSDGKLGWFPVNPPLKIDNALADDFDITPSQLTKTTARNTEAIIALDEKYFLASFVNYYQAADGKNKRSAVVGPGVVALFAVDNNRIKMMSSLVTPFKNPSWFVKKDAKTIWVLCSGEWSYSDQGLLISRNAGLIKLSIDGDLLSISHEIALKDFSPAIPTIVSNKLVIPRSFGADLAIIDEQARAITPKDIIKAPIEAFFTVAVYWHDDIIFVGDAQGKLIAYSMREGFFPFPFSQSIVLDEKISEKAFLSPQQIYFRHQIEGYDLATTHKTGFSAWVLSSHHLIYLLDFLAVFGP